MMIGKVVKNIADKFSVVGCDGEIIENCTARGNLKVNGKVLVGDNVDYEVNQWQAIITRIEKRRNEFIRPSISNIDIMLIVISEVPSVDLLLLDKLILCCKLKNVEPLIVVNKEDISSADFINEIKSTYQNSGVDLVVLSTKTQKGKDVLIEKIRGKLACLAGQSAVGKSSIINMLMNEDVVVGELSKRIERGKNTTRHVEIFYNESDNIFIADTVGFSKFDAIDVAYNKIESYYCEFDAFRQGCKYKPCSHIFEKEQDCAVKCALNDCKINKNRYNNYKQIYMQIKDAWEKKYE